MFRLGVGPRTVDGGGQVARSVKSLLAAVVALASVVVGVNQAHVLAAPTESTSVPHYDHIFEIVEENHGLADVIGNPAAPNLNSLAQQFGLA
jgi:hypothetical protein